WEVAKRYGTDKLPETYLVVHGQVVQKFVGQTDWDSPELRQLLANRLEDAGPAGDPELAGHAHGEAEGGVAAVLAAAAPLQAVAAQADVDAGLVVGLRETVFAGDGDVGELGVGERAEALLA